MQLRYFVENDNCIMTSPSPDTVVYGLLSNFPAVHTTQPPNPQAEEAQSQPATNAPCALMEVHISM